MVSMCMREWWRTTCRAMFKMLRHLWAYSGTLAALSLMTAVLGMSLYYLIVGEPKDNVADLHYFRNYVGVYNAAGPHPPRGLGMSVAQTNTELPMIQFEYNSQGNPVRVVCMGSDGKIQTMPGSSVAEQKLSYDASGRLMSKRNYDAVGRPAPDAHGIVATDYHYNDSGLFTHADSKDSGGQMRRYSQKDEADRTKTRCYEQRTIPIGDTNYVLSLFNDGSTEIRPAP